MSRIKRERRLAQKSMAMGILKGTAWAAAITVGGAGIMAAWILNGGLKETAIGYTAMAVLFLASLIGAVTSARSVGKQLVLAAMLTGLAYFLLLAAVNALVYKGGYEGVGATALMILAGSGTVVLMKLNRKEKRPRIKV